jgi:5-methylcytosine-specific restriction endonuclease McrA
MFEHVIDDCQCEGKTCTKCSEEKCHGAFYTDKRAKDGRTSSCRECINAQRRLKRQEDIETSRAYHREYQRRHAEQYKEQARKRYQEDEEARKKKSAYYYANAERIKQQRKEHQQTHAQQIKAYRKKRYQEFADKFKEQKREYYQGNVELIKTRKRKYRKANPELYAAGDKAKFAKRRTRKALAGGEFTPQQWLMLKAKYSFSCLCCGRREPDIQLTVDHVIPLVKGGSNNIENIQPLCISCNSKKYDKTIDYRTGVSSDEHHIQS